MEQSQKERHSYFYVGSKYESLPEVPSSPFKVIRVYLSQAPLPHLSMVYVGALFAGASLAAVGAGVELRQLGAIFITTLTGLATLWILNLLDEVLDVEADSVVHPERPIASKTVTVRDTVVVIAALIVTALALNFTHAFKDGAFYGCMIAVDVSILALSGRLRFPAANELLTPLLWAAMPIYMFWVLNPAQIALGALLACFGYFADLASDIPGGIQDVEGDRRQGVQTVATAVGPKKAAIVAALSFAACVVPLYVFLIMRGFPRWTLALELALFVWAVLPFSRLSRDQNERNCKIARAIAFHFVSLTYILIGIAVVLAAV